MNRLVLPCGLILAAALCAQEPISVPQADAATAKGLKKGLYATLNTSMGPIIVKFFEKEAPETVRNFVELAMGTKEYKDPKTGAMKKAPFYNGTIFHRVIPNFMIQGGDPLGTGIGNGGFVIPDEWERSFLQFNVPGRVAMANSGPGTSSTQFFITDGPATHLNQQHTIFGNVQKGRDIVRKIARVATDADDKPNTPVVLESVVVYRVGPEPGSK